MAVGFSNTRNDRLEITGLSQSLGGFTAMWWFRVPTAGTKNDFATHVSIENTAGSSWLYVEGAGIPNGFKAQLSGSDASFPTISYDTWYWIAVTKSSAGNNVKGYQELATHTAEPSSRFSSNLGAAFTFNKVLIGENDIFTGETFLGRLAGFKLFTTEMSTAQLALEKRQLAPFNTASLFAFWPLHSDALKLRDDSGAGRPLTAPTASTWETEDGPPVPWRRGRSKFFVPAAAAGGTTGTVAVSTSASVAAAGTPVISGTVAVSTSAAVAAAGSPVATGAIAVTTSASVAASGPVTGTVELATSASVAAAGSPIVSGTAGLATSAAVAAAGTPVISGTATLETSAALVAAGTLVAVAAVALSPDAAAAAAGTPVITGTVGVSTSASVAAAGSVGDSVTGTAAVSTAVSLAAAGSPIVAGTVDVATAGASVVAAGAPIVSGAVELGTSAAVAAVGTLTAAGAVALSTDLQLLAAGTPVITGTIGVSTSASVTAAGTQGNVESPANLTFSFDGTGLTTTSGGNGRNSTSGGNGRSTLGDL